MPRPTEFGTCIGNFMCLERVSNRHLCEPTKTFRFDSWLLMRTCCKVLWVIRLSTSAIEHVVRRYEVSKTNENSERCRAEQTPRS